MNLSFPHSFLAERACLTWRDVYFGLVNDLIGAQAAIGVATQRIGEADDPSGALIDLAWARPSDCILGFIESLAAGEPPASADEQADKWLYLVLAWTYEQRHLYANPLERVQVIYADFGYPAHIADLSMLGVQPARWTEPGSTTAKLPERVVAAMGTHGVIERWRMYLEDSATLYQPAALKGRHNKKEQTS